MRLDLRRIGRQWRENDLTAAGRNISDRGLDAVDKDAMRFLIAPGPNRRMGDELLFDPGQDIRREIEDADNAAVGLDAIQVRAFAAVDQRRIWNGPAQRRGVDRLGLRQRLARNLGDRRADGLRTERLRNERGKIIITAIYANRQHQTAHIFQTSPSSSSSQGRFDTFTVRPPKLKVSPCTGASTSLLRTSMVI